MGDKRQKNRPRFEHGEDASGPPATRRSGLRFSYLHREPVVFAGPILIIILLFVFTSFVVSAYHRKWDGLVRLWFSRGEQALQAGKADVAVDCFRNALTDDPASDVYRLRLAQALIAISGRRKRVPTC